MFYLETKDGEKFFTDPKSDDFVEFEKIIEQKLGRSAADMFNQLIDEARHTVPEHVAANLSYLIEEMKEIRDLLL